MNAIRQSILVHGIDLLIYLLIGAGTGFVSGMFGIGGGSVRIPLLAMSGMPLLEAYATNMVAIPFSSATGAYVQRKKIKWGIVPPFVAGGCIGIAIATTLVDKISEPVLAAIFCFAALITVVGLYMKQLDKKLYRRLHYTRNRLFFGALASNFIIGMRGGSGGTLFPPLLSAMHVKMHKAVATSHVASFFSSLVALSIYLYNGTALVGEGALMGIAGIAGSYAGSKVSMNTDSDLLRGGLAVLVVALACSVLYNVVA